VESKDEVGILAQAFNSMTEQLYVLINSLEQRVAERTRDLARRSTYLEASAEVGRAAVSILETDRLFQEVVELIQQKFDLFYYVAVFLLDETRQWAVLRAANSKGGQDGPAHGHKLRVGGQGIVGWTAHTGQSRVALDVGADAVQFDTPLLPDTRSEMALPLKVGVQVLGVLYVQSTQETAFSEEDVAVLQTLADQLAIAIENARLYQEIRREKQYFESLVLNSPVAIIVTDLDFNIISWSPAAERLFGHTEAEAVDCNLDDLIVPHVKRAEADVYNQQTKQGNIAHAITQRKRKDQTMVDVELFGVPVIIEGGHVGGLWIYHDITELQQARQEALEARRVAESNALAAEEARAVAEAANQAKSIFLANMSHELRTPLNAILGFAQLMERDSAFPAKHRENLGIINRSGEHLLNLLNDVLEMSKIEAGRVELQLEAFDLHHMLLSLEEMFRMRADQKGLALRFERAPDVPRYVRADEGKLRQVLINLLGNAVKFTEQGGVTLRVEAKGQGLETKEYHRLTPAPQILTPIYFEVEDTGPGIAPDELHKAFEAFVQTSSGQRSEKGTGLGLPISREFTRLMGGELAIDSQVGQGTAFKFDMQVEIVEAADVPDAEPTRRVIGLEPGQCAADGAPFRILVVDDVETARKLLVKFLEPLGFELQEATNGQEALKIWEAWQPHLIWMDMRMPIIDGREATRRIKARAQTKNLSVPVIIALTASAFEEQRAEVLAGGCDDFVRKPFREHEIFDALHCHLGVRFIYEAITPAPAAATSVSMEELRAAVESLPAAWATDLYQATVAADINQILVLIEAARPPAPHLADTLAQWAHNFEYDKLTALVAPEEASSDATSQA
jgi:two-component system sensor histidine kinase/response regulator